jgi:hypothetical protein
MLFIYLKYKLGFGFNWTLHLHMLEAEKKKTNFCLSEKPHREKWQHQKTYTTHQVIKLIDEIPIRST